jgi:hypothetical protein
MLQAGSSFNRKYNWLFGHLETPPEIAFGNNKNEGKKVFNCRQVVKVYAADLHG